MSDPCPMCELARQHASIPLSFVVGAAIASAPVTGRTPLDRVKRTLCVVHREAWLKLLDQALEWMDRTDEAQA